jgi:hypothetical protein
MNFLPDYINSVYSITGVHINTIEETLSMVKLKIPIRKRTKNLIGMQLVRCMIEREYPKKELETILELILQ